MLKIFVFIFFGLCCFRFFLIFEYGAVVYYRLCCQHFDNVFFSEQHVTSVLVFLLRT